MTPASSRRRRKLGSRPIGRPACLGEGGSEVFTRTRLRRFSNIRERPDSLCCGCRSAPRSTSRFRQRDRAPQVKPTDVVAVSGLFVSEGPPGQPVYSAEWNSKSLLKCPTPEVFSAASFTNLTASPTNLHECWLTTQSTTLLNLTLFYSAAFCLFETRGFLAHR